MSKGITNSLAIAVDEYIKSKGIKKTFIAKQMEITYTYFNKLMEKDNFTIDDANRILAAIDCKIEYHIVPVDKE